MYYPTNRFPILKNKVLSRTIPSSSLCDILAVVLNAEKLEFLNYTVNMLEMTKLPHSRTNQWLSLNHRVSETLSQNNRPRTSFFSQQTRAIDSQFKMAFYLAYFPHLFLATKSKFYFSFSLNRLSLEIQLFHFRCVFRKPVKKNSFVIYILFADISIHN